MRAGLKLSYWNSQYKNYYEDNPELKRKNIVLNNQAIDHNTAKFLTCEKLWICNPFHNWLGSQAGLCLK